eukprot:scaffold12220_cov204-Skeletonema_marinoi.AAC.1
MMMMMIWIEFVDDNGCLDSDCVALSKQQATQLKRKGGALIFTYENSFQEMRTVYVERKYVINYISYGRCSNSR